MFLFNQKFVESATLTIIKCNHCFKAQTNMRAPYNLNYVSKLYMIDKLYVLKITFCVMWMVCGDAFICSVESIKSL